MKDDDDKEQIPLKLIIRNKNWKPGMQKIDRVLENFVKEVIPKVVLKVQKPYENLKPLNDLLHDPDIIITQADKNLGITVVTRDWYTTEMSKQLSDEQCYQKGTTRLPCNIQGNKEGGKTSSKIRN